MDYVSDEIPSVKVHLEAWSPKIPQDSKSSAYPAIVFDFHVNNPTKDDVDVSFQGSFADSVDVPGVPKKMTRIYNVIYTKILNLRS